ncbi:MAG TPA: hypothetical protein DD400_00705 [Rhodospirillaceae bacterium]|nr:hypothetical protein [Rhodospirillaceae bacterium]
MEDKKEYDVVGLGRAYIDIIAQAPYALLEKYGIPLDTGRYFDVDEMKLIKSQLSSSVLCAGGAVPNTLAGLAALGVRTGCLGKMARDEEGKVFLDDLKARGIDMLCEPYVENAPLSGTCIVLLTEGGERSFALHNGCVDSFTLEDFSNFDFGRARIFLLYVSFLSNSVSHELVAQAVAMAHAKGCQIVMSLSEVRSWERREKMALEVVAPYVDIIIGNEAENEALFDVTGPLQDEKHLVITTRGARGASARQGTTEKHVKAYKGDGFVSSLGAGDQFLAGFLKGQVMGLPLEEKLALAARAAAEIIKKPEARPSVDADWRGIL